MENIQPQSVESDTIPKKIKRLSLFFWFFACIFFILDAVEIVDVVHANKALRFSDLLLLVQFLSKAVGLIGILYWRKWGVYLWFLMYGLVLAWNILASTGSQGFSATSFLIIDVFVFAFWILLIREIWRKWAFFK